MGEKRPGKTKVLHISHTDIRTDSRILKELKALSEAGIYSVSAVGVDSRKLEREAEISSEIFIDSVPLFFTKSKWRPSLLRHGLALIEFVIKVFFRSRKYKPDVIHCHDTLAFLVGSLLSFFVRAKLVYDAHELESRKNAQSKLASKIVLLTEKIFWKRVDLLISVSPSILRWYDSNLGEKPTALVLNAPQLLNDNYTSNNEKKNYRYFHEKFGMPDDSIVFIYLGLLVAGRGVQLLLDSFANIEGRAHVVFMGYGELDEKIVESSKKNSNIHYHPAVPHTEVVKLTKSADVGLCLVEKASLSDYYCLPNKLFEYAFSGIPVLASKFPDLEEYIEKYKLGECSPLDVTSIKKRIEGLVGSPLPTVNSDLAELSWQAQQSRLVSMYQNMLEK